MTFSSRDRDMMRRALQLAANGRGHVSPNPMVGAVITGPDGRIIGEGWHRRFGGPHAEVNAVRSVSDADRAVFPESTIYVTLEPCSHYGKTPPCALLLKECAFARVVVGAGDPNPKVAGRGIAMLREGGIRVDTGLLADECHDINLPFMTAHTLHRPFVTLKWARSADGYMDHLRDTGTPAARFSTPLSSQLVHLRRSLHDAIAVGARTVLADNPRLDVRYIDGRNPRPVIFDRRRLVDPASTRLSDNAIHITGSENLADILHRLYADEGITSMLVEGGASLLGSFIAAGLWDEAYEEVAPVCLGTRGSVPAPVLPVLPTKVIFIGDNYVNFYSHKRCRGVKNI